MTIGMSIVYALGILDVVTFVVFLTYVYSQDREDQP